jgi:hypothetical protein
LDIEKTFALLAEFFDREGDLIAMKTQALHAAERGDPEDEPPARSPRLGRGEAAALAVGRGLHARFAPGGRIEASLTPRGAVSRLRALLGA